MVVMLFSNLYFIANHFPTTVSNIRIINNTGTISSITKASAQLDANAGHDAIKPALVVNSNIDIPDLSHVN